MPIIFSEYSLDLNIILLLLLFILSLILISYILNLSILLVFILLLSIFALLINFENEDRFPNSEFETSYPNISEATMVGNNDDESSQPNIPESSMGETNDDESSQPNVPESSMGGNNDDESSQPNIPESSQPNVPESSMGGNNDDESEGEDRPERSRGKELNISFVESQELRDNLNDKFIMDKFIKYSDDSHKLNKKKSEYNKIVDTIIEETDDTDADDQWANEDQDTNVVVMHSVNVYNTEERLKVLVDELKKKQKEINNILVEDNISDVSDKDNTSDESDKDNTSDESDNDDN
uniref:Uncharacterized protein n=1 Tax=Orbilia oligospora TaxID=2813651 RepID=A0A6G6A4T1_ORBOL|nr:hypothetical protein [Orbilia oligospora]QID02822.1 hypothetical protein [Orbilia oligospora]